MRAAGALNSSEILSMKLRFSALALLLLLPLASAFAKPLVVCTEASPEGFDPVRYSTLTITNASADVIFNGLVTYDDATATVQPALAQSWDVSDSGTVYTFHLRPNVHFQTTDYFKPTRTLDADDVVATFDRMLNPENAWRKALPTIVMPNVQSMQITKLIKSVDKVDPLTVRFVLNRSDATFLPILTMSFTSIYSAEYLSQLLKTNAIADLNAKPVSTGPFILKSYRADATIRYTVNPEYWGPKPKVDGLIYAITPDPTVRAQRVKAGECDIALAPKPDDVTSARKDPTLKVLDVPGFMTAFVALNTQRHGLDNPLVRRAVNLAFDRATYVKTLFGNSAVPATNPYPSSGQNIAGYPYDPALAKKLLAEAGMANGLSLTIWTRSTGSTLNPNPKVGAELLQADLTKIGIGARIKTLEWGELLHEIKQGQYDLLFMGWAGDDGDPDNFLSPLFSCDAVKGGTNFQRYCDPALDLAIATGKTTSAAAARAQFYENAQKIVHDEALWIPLAHPLVAAITRSDVAGYRVSPFGRVNFGSVTIR
jgi:dipeptide transport system substrate-binding protein